MVTETRTLARLDVLSVAKTIGVVYTAVGLFAGLVFALMSIIGVGLAQNDATGELGTRLLVGAGSIVCMPVVYGAIGFVAGALFAAIYNVTVRWTGGIRFDLS